MLRTSLKGRVKNTPLPLSHSLLPLHEAVVNAIQAVDQRFDGDLSGGRIEIRIIRSPQDAIDVGQIGGRVPLDAIVGFEVVDNGLGFTPENMQSFETLDSDHKAALGCRGVGRLLWLKAFDRVSVTSAYLDRNGSLAGRQFRFSEDNEVEQDSELLELDEPGTRISLEGFDKKYQAAAPKTAEAIAREVFEHCIWYFLRSGGAPEILLIDEERIRLQDLVEKYVRSELQESRFEVNGTKFAITNLALKSSSKVTTPRLNWCAANRVVTEENITSKVPGLHGRLKDAASAEFTYVGYLTSDFLDNRVRSDRTGFDIGERVPGQSSFDELTLDDIREAALSEIGKVLAEPLGSALEAGKERVHDFVSTRAPRYRPVLARIEELGVTVDPGLNDRDLELLLHNKLQQLETQTLKEGQKVAADVDALPLGDYEQRLNDYLAKVRDINQSDLAAYVSRRRVTLDLLGKLVRATERGKYSREDAIHSLLMPMRTDSNAIGTEASNLWIIDESLAFHDYLASDLPLRSIPVTGSDSDKRPDMLATRVLDAPFLAAEGERVPLPSIVVVELKRPMRKDASEENDPIQQVTEYVKRVRKGGLLTAMGRPIPETVDAPAFCYVIADLTDKMIARCEVANLEKTHDGMGYFGYNRAAKAYIEVMSYDRMVNLATQRNRAFFDKLGLPSN